MHIPAPARMIPFSVLGFGLKTPWHAPVPPKILSFQDTKGMLLPTRTIVFSAWGGCLTTFSKRLQYSRLTRPRGAPISSHLTCRALYASLVQVSQPFLSLNRSVNRYDHVHITGRNTAGGDGGGVGGFWSVLPEI